MPGSFTVIVPTHNRREALERALTSLRRQRRPAAQVIVVADGCTDGTAEMVRELNDPLVEVLDMPKGPGLGWVHRNIASERASGDFIAYLADDDMHLPDHLERMGAILDTGEVDLVQASACRVRRDGSFEVFGYDWAVPALRGPVLAGADNRTPMSAVAHRRGLDAEAGGWRTVEDGPGDLDLWRRMLETGARTAMLYEPTVLFIQSWRDDAQVHDHDDERRARGAALVERLDDPLLRAEIALAGHDSEATLKADAEKRVVEAERELPQLRERAATLEKVLAGRWWRLGERIKRLTGRATG